MGQADRLHCQLYLMADAGTDADALAEALETGEAACVLLRSRAAPEEVLRTAVGALQPVARARDVAFLIEDRPDLAADLGCDGVHLSADGNALESVRQSLGAEPIVGVACGQSRHAGLTAADAGADYVAFGGGAHAAEPGDAADLDLLSWWQAFVTVPCVAMGGVIRDTLPALAAAGADFIAVGPELWQPPEGPAAALAALRSRIEESSRPHRSGTTRADTAKHLE